MTRYERLDMYLTQLDTWERSRRQKQWFFSTAAFMAVLAVASTLFIFPRPVAQELTTLTPEYRRFLSDSLSPEKVQGLFVEEASPIVVLHSDPLIDIDTVASLDEYYQYLNQLDLQRVEQPDPVDPAYLPNFAVVVEGDKMVNQPLTYTIEGFDPEYELILDFGNGIERPAKASQMTYTYPLPGHFDMHLVLNTADTTMIIQTIKYQILPNSEEQIIGSNQTNTTIAQES